MKIELGEHVFEVEEKQITEFCGKTLIWLSDSERKRFLGILGLPWWVRGGFTVCPTNMPNTELDIMV